MADTITVVLVDDGHLAKARGTTLMTLAPATAPTSHVILATLGKGGSVMVPGIVMRDLAGVDLRWPKSLRGERPGEGKMVMEAIYDLRTILGNDAAPIRLQAHVDWTNHRALHADLRGFSALTGLAPLSATPLPLPSTPTPIKAQTPAKPAPVPTSPVKATPAKPTPTTASPSKAVVPNERSAGLALARCLSLAAIVLWSWPILVFYYPEAGLNGWPSFLDTPVQALAANSVRQIDGLTILALFAILFLAPRAAKTALGKVLIIVVANALFLIDAFFLNTQTSVVQFVAFGLLTWLIGIATLPATTWRYSTAKRGWLVTWSLLSAVAACFTVVLPVTIARFIGLSFPATPIIKPAGLLNDYTEQLFGFQWLAGSAVILLLWLLTRTHLWAGPGAVRGIAFILAAVVLPALVFWDDGWVTSGVDEAFTQAQRPQHYSGATVCSASPEAGIPDWQNRKLLALYFTGEACDVVHVVSGDTEIGEMPLEDIVLRGRLVDGAFYPWVVPSLRDGGPIALLLGDDSGEVTRQLIAVGPEPSVLWRFQCPEGQKVGGAWMTDSSEQTVTVRCGAESVHLSSADGTIVG